MNIDDAAKYYRDRYVRIKGIDTLRRKDYIGSVGVVEDLYKGICLPNDHLGHDYEHLPIFKIRIVTGEHCGETIDIFAMLTEPIESFALVAP